MDIALLQRYQFYLGISGIEYHMHHAHMAYKATTWIIIKPLTAPRLDCAFVANDYEPTQNLYNMIPEKFLYKRMSYT